MALFQMETESQKLHLIIFTLNMLKGGGTKFVWIYLQVWSQHTTENRNSFHGSHEVSLHAGGTFRIFICICDSILLQKSLREINGI